MAPGDGMLAQALLDYFDQHMEESETFLLDRAAIADGYVLWKGDTPSKQLLLTFTIFGWDGRKRSARDYALNIETLSSLAPVNQTTPAQPSHGVVDRGTSAGEDRAILDVPWRDEAWWHDLSLQGLTTINGWHLTPQSEGIWLALRADDRRPHGPGNALWNGDESHPAQHNQALGTDVFLLPLALWDGLLWHGTYGHLGLAG